MPALQRQQMRATNTGSAHPLMRHSCSRVSQRKAIVCQAGKREARQVLERLAAAGQQLAKTAAAATCAAALLWGGGPAFAEESSTLVRLPASQIPEVFSAQKTLVEAWQIVGESFVDPEFNHHNWNDELLAHMAAAYQSDQGDMAYKEIQSMLSDLGDPYTRVVPPEEYAEFRVGTDGEMQGVGLLIANEPYNNHLLVLAPIKGGPADRAGMMPGDEVVSIDGTVTEGWTGQQAAKLLRGKGGTEVQVKFVRHSQGIPGVPGRPEPPVDAQLQEVRMRRETVSLSPIFYTAMRPAGGRDTVGYIRLTSFTSNAADQMQDAITRLKAQGASSFILDLRNNPGGLVTTSMDVARLWLDGNPVVFSISGRPEDPPQRVALPSGGSSLTQAPLAVLVNENSASASEILSGALHDHGRAMIVGDAHTFGKGRIQSVFELQDGSALFVTVAKYKTPGGTDIDHKGIQPDRSCNLSALAGRPRRAPLRTMHASSRRGADEQDQQAAAPSLSDQVYEESSDKLVAAVTPVPGAGQLPPGLSVGVMSDEMMSSVLQRDSCVLTAQSLLQTHMQ